MMAEELTINIRVVPFTDDDLDAAFEAVARGATALTISDEILPEDDAFTLRLKLSPSEAQ